jgi:hypothetical protein
MVITQGLIVRRLAPLFKPEQILRFSILGLSAAVVVSTLPLTTLYWIFAVQPLLAISQGMTQPNITSIVSSLGTTENQGEILRDTGISAIFGICDTTYPGGFSIRHGL